VQNKPHRVPQALHLTALFTLRCFTRC